MADLSLIIQSLGRHYNYPVIAPNGKLEGMCLAIIGLKEIQKQIKDLKDKLRRRNMQIKDLKKQLSDFTRVDVLHCPSCQQDTVHKIGCAVCGSKE